MSDWLEICKLEEIPQGGARTVRADGVEIALFRLSDGSVRAVENRCPHKGGPLAEGIVSGHDVLCPLHNWRISLDSGEVAPPDSGCVKRWEVRLEGERVSIRIAG